MKKQLLAVISSVALIAGGTSAFGQAQVVFANNGSTLLSISNQTTHVSSLMFGPAGTFDIGLYMGASGATDISQMQLVDLATSPNAPTSSFFTAGSFSGGTVATPGNVANTINFQAGTQYAFIVAAWSAADGSTYAAALASGDANGYTGLSALGFVTPLAPPSGAPNTFGTAAGQVGGFTLVTPVPEPTTLALGGLGAAALLMFRRRK